MSSDPATDLQKVCNVEENKRILITNVNGLLGHSLFESMRNDHITITQEGKQPHRFLGTMNGSNAGTPSPSETIKLLDSKAKKKTFIKQVREADYIILDISQFVCNLEEAEMVIKSLKF